ncbi:hypothetical protein [Streptomyces kebangsaanensis]|uniref:hypothetical protein n=1 Tax=Streptomyces kebangsaanensis TaxID=864058 RepID=UPI0018FF004C|nr:hypothetical protein [Streptomyces kebangsaanensis]
MLAHMYVEGSPVGFVMILVLASPLALAALPFAVIELVPSLRKKYSLARGKDPIERKLNSCGCYVATLALSGLVALGIWGLVTRL